mmetsp:Transcript_45059/g.88851  ORF Transcript_45059/g.88851 Transcript_45059/m.88851 type:complete len:245 (+) Transcript_45059:82-816(+)
MPKLHTNVQRQKRVYAYIIELWCSQKGLPTVPTQLPFESQKKNSGTSFFSTCQAPSTVVAWRPCNRPHSIIMRMHACRHMQGESCSQNHSIDFSFGNAPSGNEMSLLFAGIPTMQIPPSLPDPHASTAFGHHMPPILPCTCLKRHKSKERIRSDDTIKSPPLLHQCCCGLHRTGVVSFVFTKLLSLFLSFCHGHFAYFGEKKDFLPSFLSTCRSIDLPSRPSCIQTKTPASRVRPHKVSHRSVG